MTRQLIPFAVSDLSTLAKSLRISLSELGRSPSHVELLNLLARAGGYRNIQHLRADAQAQERLSADPAAPPIDHSRVEKVLRHFDAEGRMIRWPAKTNHQDLCLWVIWSRIPADQRMDESEINQIIKDAHGFGDHAILRRSLVDLGLLVRTPDGRLYRRVEKKPDADAAALLAAIGRSGS